MSYMYILCPRQPGNDTDSRWKALSIFSFYFQVLSHPEPTRVKSFIAGFQSRDETAMLVHKTIVNYGPCFAL